MSDRLYLSCWLRGFAKHAQIGPRATTGRDLMRHYEKMLELFPYSKLSQRPAVVHVYAAAYSEPVLAEHNFDPGTSPEDMVAIMREFVQDHDDCAVELEAEWDLWQYGESGWHLGPARVLLAGYGPEFDNEDGDQLRIEFGLDSRFLPLKGVAGSLRTAQSNLRSLLHLVGELERVLPIERRLLWSESGENFAALVAETLGQIEVN